MIDILEKPSPTYIKDKLLLEFIKSGTPHLEIRF